MGVYQRLRHRLAGRAIAARRLTRRRPTPQPHDPLLSVVVPVYNTEAYLEQAIDSALNQSYGNLEIIIVDDGSTDASAALAEQIVARDPRCRLVSQPNSGLGSARNTGARHATGELLAFLDSDDMVLAGAYQAMVSSLTTSGLDFVTGAVVRGDEVQSSKPAWVRRAMAQTRRNLVIDDHPEMLLDITAPNKVFRRSFWNQHELRFPGGVRYEDQVPMTKAFLVASSFDVLTREVYLWRTRPDGTSISQQKWSIEDLRDRTRSQLDCHELIELYASQRIRDEWFRKLLAFDLTAYVELALDASDEYCDMLCGRLAEISHDVSASTWGRVPFYPRVMSWLLADSNRQGADAFSTYAKRNPRGMPLQLVDGAPHFAIEIDRSVLGTLPSEFWLSPRPTSRHSLGSLTSGGRTVNWSSQRGCPHEPPSHGAEAPPDREPGERAQRNRDWGFRRTVVRPVVRRCSPPRPRGPHGLWLHGPTLASPGGRGLRGGGPSDARPLALRACARAGPLHKHVHVR